MANRGGSRTFSVERRTLIPDWIDLLGGIPGVEIEIIGVEIDGKGGGQECPPSGIYLGVG